VAAPVEEHAREVESLVEDRREGRADHRDAHLAADVHEVVVDHGEGDGIDHARVRSRMPVATTESVQPGGTTTVESIDSTISGPRRVSSQLATATRQRG